MGGCYSAQSSRLSESKCRRCLPSISSDPEDDSLKPVNRTAATPRTPSASSVILNPSSGDEFLRHYTLGKELGRGEFGVTRRCTHVETGEVFACKTISKRRLQSSVDRADVKREVEIMRHLPAHKNIVQLKDAFEDSEAVHLVMELCQGGELFDRIVARGHYTERAAAILAKTVIELVQVSS